MPIYGHLQELRGRKFYSFQKDRYIVKKGKLMLFFHRKKGYLKGALDTSLINSIEKSNFRKFSFLIRSDDNCIDIILAATSTEQMQEWLSTLQSNVSTMTPVGCTLNDYQYFLRYSSTIDPTSIKFNLAILNLICSPSHHIKNNADIHINQTQLIIRRNAFVHQSEPSSKTTPVALIEGSKFSNILGFTYVDIYDKVHFDDKSRPIGMLIICPSSLLCKHISESVLMAPVISNTAETESSRNNFDGTSSALIETLSMKSVLYNAHHESVAIPFELTLCLQLQSANARRVLGVLRAISKVPFTMVTGVQGHSEGACQHPSTTLPTTPSATASSIISKPFFEDELIECFYCSPTLRYIPISNPDHIYPIGALVVTTYRLLFISTKLLHCFLATADMANNSSFQELLDDYSKHIYVCIPLMSIIKTELSDLTKYSHPTHMWRSLTIVNHNHQKYLFIFQDGIFEASYNQYSGLTLPPFHYRHRIPTISASYNSPPMSTHQSKSLYKTLTRTFMESSSCGPSRWGRQIPDEPVGYVPSDAVSGTQDGPDAEATYAQVQGHSSDSVSISKSLPSPTETGSPKVVPFVSDSMRYPDIFPPPPHAIGGHYSDTLPRPLDLLTEGGQAGALEVTSADVFKSSIWSINTRLYLLTVNRHSERANYLSYLCRVYPCTSSAACGLKAASSRYSGAAKATEDPPVQGSASASLPDSAVTAPVSCTNSLCSEKCHNSESSRDYLPPYTTPTATDVPIVAESLHQQYHHRSDHYSDYNRIGVTGQTDDWRMTTVNVSYSLCGTYPALLWVPASIPDEVICEAAHFRSRGRIPALSWWSRRTNCSLGRCSQPLVGITSKRSRADEQLVAAFGLCSMNGAGKPLLIADARPQVNVMANTMVGKGIESEDHYQGCDIIYLNIANIHAVRESWRRLCRDLRSSFEDDGPSEYSTLQLDKEKCPWLHHISSIISGAVHIARCIDSGTQSVLVHCSDGWDRTSQLVSLSMLLLDPYYRTISGFQILIEKEWLSFGFKFQDRLGWTAKGLKDNEMSPIFEQFLDCVHQCVLQLPDAFEFNGAYLLLLLEYVRSGWFPEFLFNCEQDRNEFLKKTKLTRNIWSVLDNNISDFVNIAYRPSETMLYPACDVHSLSIWTALFNFV